MITYLRDNYSVIPAKAGIQRRSLDVTRPPLRGDDAVSIVTHLRSQFVAGFYSWKYYKWERD